MKLLYEATISSVTYRKGAIQVEYIIIIIIIIIRKPDDTTLNELPPSMTALPL
jgi:hypothetical protein